MKNIFKCSAMILLMIVQIINGQVVKSYVNLTLNPYENVNWSTYGQYKANFHTHTTNSDGADSPSEVIDQYYSAGYDILAITDHDYTTWSWPSNPGMIAVRGNEYSNSHHMNAFYDFTSSDAGIEDGIPHVDASGGLSLINHPGRYYTPNDWAWYIPWYSNYPSCVGLEVYNQGDRYPDDRELWDNINENYFSQYSKLVWGYSNDDKHTTDHLYGNYQFMLMPEKTEDALRTSQQEGAFYFCYEPGRSGDALVPRISDITVDDLNKTITITATGYTSIDWIGPGTTTVGSGTTFDYSAYTDVQFVRAILYNTYGSTYTQPFGFETYSETPPVTDFVADKTNAIPGEMINFADNSANAPTSWSWTFTGGTPPTSTEQNPTVSYSSLGTYEVSLTTSNEFGSDTETKTAFITISNSASISISVISGMDDVEEQSGGSMYTDSSDLEFCDDGGDQKVGIRFQNINIPQGAIIDSAYIEVRADESDTKTLNHILFAAEDIDNSPAFTTSDYNVSDRTLTANYIEWINPPSWSAESVYYFPDMSNVIQEVVDREGWASGNSMSFIFWQEDIDSDERVADPYEGGYPPVLHIDYTIPGEVIPSTPLNISTSVIGTNLTISWDESTDADSYDVYSSDDPNGTFSFEVNVATNQYVTPYTDAKKFYYIVAKNSLKK